MKVLEKAQTVRTTDVVVIHDEEKNVKWFLAMDRTNDKFEWNNGCLFREMINSDYFKTFEPEYRQKVYELAYNEIIDKK